MNSLTVNDSNVKYYYDDGTRTMSELGEGNKYTYSDTTSYSYNYNYNTDFSAFINGPLKSIENWVPEKPRPTSKIKKVYFNRKKRTTVVLWEDGMKTKVTCHELDIWDPEKALAMCFMKRFYDNRGCFNDIMNEIIDNAEFIRK